MTKSPEPDSSADTRRLLSDHPRVWHQFQYVYPVISRRSAGLSIGVNLNIDKTCNFDCVYCQVDWDSPPPRKDVDLDQLGRELSQMLALAASGEIWTDPSFTGVVGRYRRVNDIAFSGDGEPTVHKLFEPAVRSAVDLKAAHGLDDVKIVVISNATGFDRPGVKRAFELLDDHQGEIWAKLDAGTEDYYRQIDRSRFSFGKVLTNILKCGQQRPIVIQSLFLQLRGEPVSDAEFHAYLDRLADLHEQGCQIKLVQLHTVARKPAESFVTALSNAQLDRLAERLRERMPDLPVQTYYGVG